MNTENNHALITQLMSYIYDLGANSLGGLIPSI